MEYDRYAYNSKLFITCMISLVLCLSLASFIIYIMPHLIWNWHYDVPEFVSHWRERLVQNHNMTRTSANWTIFLSFFIPAVVSGLIAYFTSNRLDNDIYGLTPEKNPEEEGLIVEDIKETASFGSKLFLLIIAIVAVVFFVEWLIAVPPPQ